MLMEENFKGKDFIADFLFAGNLSHIHASSLCSGLKKNREFCAK